jgi:translation initiation factor eIF-2B subunit epsilon
MTCRAGVRGRLLFDPSQRGTMAGRRNAPKEGLEGKQKLQAVIIADSFDGAFRPLTLQLPRVLMPLAGIPMLEYNIHLLWRHGVEEIVIYCSSHADQIEVYLEKSQWTKKSDLKVTVLSATDQLVRCEGDMLRDLDQSSTLHGDFILTWGDTIADFNLSALLDAHSKAKATEKDALLYTLAFSRASQTAGSLPSLSSSSQLAHTTDDNDEGGFIPGFGAQNHTDIIFLNDKHRVVEYVGAGRAHLNKKPPHVPLEFITQESLSCSGSCQFAHVAVVTQEGLVFMSDNFDFSSVVPDALRGCLMDDIAGKVSYAYMMPQASDPYGFSQRASTPMHYRSLEIAVRAGRIPLPLSLPPNEHAHCVVDAAVWAGTTLGPGCQVGKGAIIGSRCVIGAGAVIGEGCLIASGTHVPANAVLKAGTRWCSTADYQKHEEQKNSGSDHSSSASFSAAASDVSGGEEDASSTAEGNSTLHEWIQSVEMEDTASSANSDEHSMHSMDASDMEDTDDGEYVGEDDAHLNIHSTPSGSLRDPRIADMISSPPVERINERLYREIQDTMSRSTSRMDDALVELVSLRMSYDAPAMEMSEGITRGILSCSPWRDHSAINAKLLALKQGVTRWAPALIKLASGPSLPCQRRMLDALSALAESDATIMGVLSYLLRFYYDADLLSEDAILDWSKECSAPVQEACADLITWLEEADEEDDDDDDDEEEEDDD